MEENPRVKMQELTNSRGRPTEMCEDDLTKMFHGGMDISAYCRLRQHSTGIFTFTWLRDGSAAVTAGHCHRGE